MKRRLVDLSHTLHPGREERLLETEMLKANEVNPNVRWLPDQWYIMHNFRMVSHIGTHMEAPYHVNKEGHDVASVPLDCMIGDAIVLDLRGYQPRAEISLGQVRDAATRAGGIEPGDLVLLQTGWDQYYGTAQYSRSPFPSPEAVRWLVDQGIKMLGIDTGGAEVPGSEQHVNHHAMMDRGIPHIENLRNLGALRRSRVFLMAAPLAVDGIESMPMRVVAMETE